MARGQKPLNGFKKGKSPNPTGRPPLDPDLKGARALNTVTLTRLLNNLVHMNATQLNNLIHDPMTDALQLMVCRVMIEGIKHGDQNRLNFLFDRIVGKVTDRVAHTMPQPTVIKLRNEDAAVILGTMQKDEDD